MSYVTIYFISTFILDSWSPETIEGDSHLQWCQEKQKKPHKQQWNKHSQQNQLKQLQTGSEQLLIIFLKYPRGKRVLSFRSHCKRFHEFAALTLNAVFPSSVLAWCTWKARQSLARVRSGPEFLCNRDVMYDGNFPVRAL